MKFYSDTTPKRIVAEEGKHIRSKDDVYVPAHYDKEGNLVEEHLPYYATTIFVPNSYTEEDVIRDYVEEDII